MKCPYCDSEISDSVSVCPHCMANVKLDNSNITKDNSKPSTEEKKKYIVYYVVISVFTISLLILVSLNIVKFIPSKVNVDNDNKKSTKPTAVSPVPISKNVGEYSGKEHPIAIGNMTIASIKDEKNNRVTPIDVKITRFLTDEEVNVLIPSSNQELIEGFVFRGVEYEVYFRDLNYLHDDTLKPILKSTLYDTVLLNNFFLVNEHYYNNKVVNFYNGPNIKNNEMAKVQAIYQVPINQSYLLCFGEKESFLGCYIN